MPNYGDIFWAWVIDHTRYREFLLVRRLLREPAPETCTAYAESGQMR